VYSDLAVGGEPQVTCSRASGSGKIPLAIARRVIIADERNALR
jgi:hypothetical protein